MKLNFQLAPSLVYLITIKPLLSAMLAQLNLLLLLVTRLFSFLSYATKFHVRLLIRLRCKWNQHGYQALDWSCPQAEAESSRSLGWSNAM